MDDRIDIQEFYKGLDIMFQKKDSKETMRYLDSWLKTAEEKADRSGIVAVCNELGGLCRVTGQIERAKELYRRVLENLEQMGLSSTEHYATALINMGDVYINGKEPQQALELFLKARTLLEKCGLTGDYRMAALCNNISAIYRDTGQFEGFPNTGGNWPQPILIWANCRCGRTNWKWQEKALKKRFGFLKRIPEVRTFIIPRLVPDWVKSFFLREDWRNPKNIMRRRCG